MVDCCEALQLNKQFREANNEAIAKKPESKKDPKPKPKMYPKPLLKAEPKKQSQSHNYQHKPRNYVQRAMQT